MHSVKKESKKKEKRKKKEAAYIQTLMLPCCLGLPYQHDRLGQVYALVGPPRFHDTRRLSRTPLGYSLPTAEAWAAMELQSFRASTSPVRECE